MARELLFMKAINEALDMAMAKDDKIILLGEDIAGGVIVLLTPLFQNMVTCQLLLGWL